MTLSIPEAALTAPATDVDVVSPNWRLFDPGFLVDHLPFRISVGQNISYSDNVRNLPASGSLALAGLGSLPSRGDFYSDTTVSVASRFPMGAQAFFFNGTYAPRRYFKDTVLDAENYSVNGGVDFNVANRCSGRLIGAFLNAQTEFDQTAGFGVENTTTTSFNQTARCDLIAHVAGLFSSGVSRLENTGGTNLAGTGVSFALNNSTQYYVSGGLEYSLSSLDTFRGLITFTQRDYDNRAANLGLANQTQQTDYQLFYDRILSAKLDVSASGGFSVFQTGVAGAKDLTEPVYSFSINYRPTPKIGASFTDSRSVGAPQGVIANVQTTDAQSLSLNYRYSPKISISGILSQTSQSTPPGAALSSVNGLPLIFTNSNTKSASTVLTYSATPLVTATASYTYAERTDTSRSGFNAVSNIFRVGLFYTR
ncbi:hypothetical protein [Lichenifustis flavocetrariae]|uniref:Uncharacterized protein n=1 Tax=Lichenifustis flavocetrariae TaxID=2949735 RepID=A0AA41Z217_9HYPH|nr:hypothetical protein [Lichenifustis flavocetrariae]MCW6509053.1 hypothetical protein [Lichenifustis flavocetrariae]